MDVRDFLDRVVDFFLSSRRRHTRLQGDWSSDVCSSDLTSGFPCDSASEQGLSSTRRSNQENSFGNLPTKSGEALWVKKELDKLLKLFLCLITSVYVAEADSLVLRLDLVVLSDTCA